MGHLLLLIIMNLSLLCLSHENPNERYCGTIKTRTWLLPALTSFTAPCLFHCKRLNVPLCANYVNNDKALTILAESCSLIYISISICQLVWHVKVLLTLNSQETGRIEQPSVPTLFVSLMSPFNFHLMFVLYHTLLRLSRGFWNF